MSLFDTVTASVRTPGTATSPAEIDTALTAQVRGGSVAASVAARRLLDLFH